MKRSTMFGVAVLAAFGFASVGCLNDNTLANSGSGGSAGTGSGGASGGSTTSSSSGGSNSGGSGGGSGGAGSGGASGGSSTASSSGGSGSGGSTTSSGTCGTTDGSYKEDTTFGTAGSTAPYKLNAWGTWGDGKGTPPALTQTTTGPSGLDCGSGCAMLSIDFSDKTAQYSAGSFVEYFGTASDSVENLLNETITAKIAVEVKQASGANTAVPISINLFGQDTYVSTSGVDNLWSNDLGSAASLDAASGWHTATFKVVDAKVPSWSPTRTVCASALHAIGITIQNTAVIDGSNGAVITLYVQSVTVGGGSGGGSGGSGGGSGGSGSGGAGGGGTGGDSSGGAGGSSGGAGGDSSGGASGGSTTSTGGSTSTAGACGTSDGSYKEDTTFGTSGSTAPYKLNAWGTWGDGKGTPPALTQTTTGPSGLDCGSGCAMLSIDFSDKTAQYSAGSFVEYFGAASDSVENLLNETITAKIAVEVKQASGATTAVPLSINLFGQDTYTSTSGVDNAWSNDLGGASSLEAASGWHTVTFKVVDAKVPSWSPTRTVCASALHAIGITIQNTAAIDGTNGAVVSLYVQRAAVGTP